MHAVCTPVYVARRARLATKSMSKILAAACTRCGRLIMLSLILRTRQQSPDHVLSICISRALIKLRHLKQDQQGRSASVAVSVFALFTIPYFTHVIALISTRCPKLTAPVMQACCLDLHHRGLTCIQPWPLAWPRRSYIDHSGAVLTQILLSYYP